MFEKREAQCKNTYGFDVMICKAFILAGLTGEWVNTSLKGDAWGRVGSELEALPGEMFRSFARLAKREQRVIVSSGVVCWLSASCPRASTSMSCISFPQILALDREL